MRKIFAFLTVCMLLPIHSHATYIPGPSREMLEKQAFEEKYQQELRGFAPLLEAASGCKIRQDHTVLWLACEGFSNVQEERVGMRMEHDVERGRVVKFLWKESLQATQRDKDIVDAALRTILQQYHPEALEDTVARFFAEAYPTYFRPRVSDLPFVLDVILERRESEIQRVLYLSQYPKGHGSSDPEEVRQNDILSAELETLMPALFQVSGCQTKPFMQQIGVILQCPQLPNVDKRFAVWYEYERGQGVSVHFSWIEPLSATEDDKRFVQKVLRLILEKYEPPSMDQMLTRFFEAPRNPVPAHAGAVMGSLSSVRVFVDREERGLRREGSFIKNDSGHPSPRPSWR